MLSLHAKRNDFIEIDGVEYQIDFSFNRVLANMELSQNEDISDGTKVKYFLMNYLRLNKSELENLNWDFNKKRQIYIAITAKLFGQEMKKSNEKPNKNDDKSVYSFVEDADFIFSSFLKDYKINLLEQKNKMHWDEFKALFVSLSQDTKIVEVMQIRSWKRSENDSKEHIAKMLKLQEIYALKQTQEQLEFIEAERQIMAEMTLDERRAYAKKQLNKRKEEKNERRKSNN